MRLVTGLVASLVFNSGCSPSKPSAVIRRKAIECPATLIQAQGDVRVRRATSTTWVSAEPPLRLCVEDRIFAGANGDAHILFGGKDESDVWVGAGSVFKVGREAPLSTRLAKIGQSKGQAWVGDSTNLPVDKETGEGKNKVEAAPNAGLRLDVLVREHLFAFPSKGMRVVAEKFPSTVVFQLTDDYLSGTRGGPSRGVLWRAQKTADAVWSASQSGRTWQVPIPSSGRFVFQVFSEETRDRTVPLVVDVLSSLKKSPPSLPPEQVALLPSELSPGVMVVLP